MKVFISWSGPLSKKLAEAIRDWLPGVIQMVNPYFTPSDIEKGGRWSTDIAKELSSSEVGVLCITRDNIHSDWILFEAGAVASPAWVANGLDSSAYAKPHSVKSTMVDATAFIPSLRSLKRTSVPLLSW